MNGDCYHDLIAELQEINSNVTKYKIVRFRLLVFVQLYMGTLLVLLPEKSYLSQSYLLDQLGIAHKIYGCLYLAGGALLVTCKKIGPRALRVAHALVAGFFALLAIVIFMALFIGSPSSAVTFPLYLLPAWGHMRAGQSSEPLSRNGKMQ